MEEVCREQPGQYQVICVRTYPNRRDLESTHTVTFNIPDCKDLTADPEDPDQLLATDADIDITDIWEGDFLLTTPMPDSTEVFAHYTSGNPGILYASTQDGIFIPAAQLETSGMFPEFAKLFAVTDPRQPLPVDLKEFNAKSERKNALLAWTTAAEVNGDHFEIEKSNTGKNWHTIGSVPCANADLTYAFQDEDITARMHYYRLKMVDRDGTFAYSRIEKLAFENSGIVVFPNPLRDDDQLHFLGEKDQVSSVIIYDFSGKQLLEITSTDDAKVQKLPAGKYHLTIRLKDGSEQVKSFVKY